jgi:acetyl esterase/lipase
MAAAVALAAAAGFARPTWLAWRMSGRVEAELTRVFGAGAKLWSWARLLTWPTRAEGVAAEAFEADGRAVDFYRARGLAVGERAPCVVLVHGGGWNSGGRGELAGLNRWLAARGVAVVAFDYRLAPEHRWPAQAEDLRVVVEWIHVNAERLGVDAERLTLVGRSAGGQIAAAAAYGEALPGVRAVVALYACHDLEFVWSIRSETDSLNSDKLMKEFLGGGPEGREAIYRSGSAEKLAHAGAPKTLLIHGALDELVWCRHSERLAAALEREGVPHVFVRMPWATHAAEANLHGPGGQLITGAVLRVARAAG